MSATQTDQLIPVGTWKSDPVHTTISFSLKHLVVATFRGRFTDFEATLVGGDEPKLTGVVHANSIIVQDENQQAHLQSPDFFDVERHPDLRFETTTIQRDGDKLTADGELTIKGVTKPVTVAGTISGPATDPYGGERLGLTLETTIDRTAFGIDFNVPLPDGGVSIGNDVTISAELEFVKEQ
jgi:polyisoprenoid-binding protein YceI